MKRTIACLLGLALAAPALAQNVLAPNGPARAAHASATFDLAVHAALPPTPALKYSLLPDATDQTAGNALTKYYKAFSPEWWSTIQRQDFAWHEGIEKALEAPLDKMPSGYGFVRGWKMLAEVDRGARMDHCDWELLPQMRQDGFATLLPDAQSMRTFSQLLALRARYELASGEIDKAVYTLETGFGLARHIGHGPTLIHMLIGVAGSQIMAKQLDALIQHPNCPNLYWALTRMPRPFIDLRIPLSGEMLTTNLLVPEYEELRKGPVSLERAQAIMAGYQQRCRTWGLANLSPGDLARQGLTVYPKAKAALVAKGRAAAEVAAMPVPQVLLLHSMDEMRRLRDDLYKWVPLPLGESDAGIKKANAAIRAARVRGDMLPEMTEVLAAVEKVRYAAARADRRFAMLRIVEAIRMYAVQNDGKLPETLATITELPVPIDPMTGKSFEYKVKDGVATIYAPAPAGTGEYEAMMYKVKIKK
jgi:hypothetical protein